MTDSRVVKLAAHYAKEDGSEVFDDLGRFAAYTIGDLEDAGLVVFDPATDETTIQRLANAYHQGAFDCPLPDHLSGREGGGVRAVLAALQAVHT
jgi:hypothetical protein